MKKCNQLAWLVVIVPVLLTGCGRSASSVFGTVGGSIGQTVGGPGSMLDAAKVADDYKADADGQYKGKDISIKGHVQSVRDDKGKKYLTIKGSHGGQAIRCDFAGDQDELAKMKAGDEVKVHGTCKGKQGSGDTFTVMLENCKLVK
jgi:hypothetical protein